MEVRRLDRQRTELFHFVLWLLLALLAAITVVSYQQGRGHVVTVLMLVSLLACLYAVGKERRLRKQQAELSQELSDEQDKSADLQARLKELSGLYRAISTVNSGVSPERTFAAVLGAALELVGGNRGSLMLLDEGERHLVIAAAEGIGEEIVAETKQRLGEGVAGWVAENCESVLLSGAASKDERFKFLIKHDQPVRFSISVPLHLRDSLLGVLNVGIVTEEPGQEFTDYHVRMITIFAQHASVAIENARLRLMHSVLLTVVDA
jgi:transcriptional regulator with GAF, ATPase, and Fis domain